MTKEPDWLFDNLGDAIGKDNIVFTKSQVTLRILINLEIGLTIYIYIVRILKIYFFVRSLCFLCT